MSKAERIVKRAIDFSCAGAGLVVLSPLFLLISILIKVDSAGPVFFKAMRIGKDGKPFSMYKFRSMVEGAENMGPGVTCQDDPRITTIGRLLRRTKIDELPQLINVLKGEMSLIGPRPESPLYWQQYDPSWEKVWQVTPGITGLAQIEYRNESGLLDKAGLERNYVQEILPQKLALDMHYVQNQSLLLDLKILLQTVKVVLLS